MRAAAAALLALIVLAGCGGAGERAGGLGAGAAELVPPDVVAFVSVDARFDSDEWQAIEDLGFSPVRLVLGRLDYERDVRPALGDELNFAVLRIEDGDPSGIVLTQSDDEAKLRRLVAGFYEDEEPLLVERIREWSVVAESEEAFDAVRRAESGRSLADVHAFQEAMAGFDGDALATAYVNGSALRELPGELGALLRVAGSPRWLGARVTAAADAARLDVRADALVPVYRPSLLREVPSGALLAISFKDGHRLLRRIAAEPSLRKALGEYQALLVDLAPALRGEGILYVQQGALLPTIVLEVESPKPDEAAVAFRRLAGRLRAETNGLLSFKVAVRNNRVLLTNGAGWPASPTRRLVDDQTFKDALAAADVPDEVSWLAYADVQRLAPIVQALTQLTGGTPPSKEQKRRLERLGTLTAFGARSQWTLRVTSR